jgi:hypothetical protein
MAERVYVSASDDATGNTPASIFIAAGKNSNT